jgi:predicted TPR repeat methyltransferase
LGLKLHNTSHTVVFSIAELQSLAIKLHLGGQLEVAEALYQKILEAAPDALDVLHFFGLLCHQQKRYEQAEKLIGRIVEIAPEVADAHNNLGNVMEGLKRRDEAEACYRKAISINPDHASAHNNLGVLLFWNRRCDEALEEHRMAVALAPGSADFRNNLGNALRKLEKLDEAVETYRETIAADPSYNGAWQGLARCYLMAGRRDLAAGVYEEWLQLFPGDQSIMYMLNACKGGNAPARAPESYIRQVFDIMAERFDAHLEGLEYHAPELLCEALVAALPATQAAFDILDAGCGTGLCGPLLKPYTGSLTGVDLSTGMLEKAALRNVYDSLVMAELQNFLARNPDHFDAIASADTLCYFGELEPVFKAAADALRPGGLFAFTLEDCGPAASEMLLNTHGRYAHRRGYVENCLLATGMNIVTFSSVHLRNEAGEPVVGHLVVAQNPPESLRIDSQT